MSYLKIAHLSDPHFGTILPGVIEGLIETLGELNPDLILLTGDITQRARRKQFRQAREFTHKMKHVPIIAVPGNHDIPLFNLFTRFFNPYWGFKNLFKNQLEKDHVFGDVLVTGLNSTSKWRHIQGKFNLKRLEGRLRENKPKARVHIAAFHHPMDCAKKSDEKNLLVGRNEVLKLFNQYKVDLAIGGHIHDPYIEISKKRYPEANRSMVFAVAGTCTSWRTRPGAPNSFNLIEVDTSSTPKLKVSRYDQKDDLLFSIKDSRSFTRGESGSWQLI